MKKITAILLAAAMLFCLCGAAKYADEEKFLEDMAQGIKERLELSKKQDLNADFEEYLKFMEKLVDCELKRLEKYDSLRFKDEELDKLAHAYIDACRLQKLSTEYKRDEELSSQLFNGGRSARAGIIIKLYEDFDLPISSGEAEQYRDSAAVSVTGLEELYNIFGSSDTVLAPGDLELKKIALSDKSSDLFTDVDIEIKNNSGVDLSSLSLNYVITDSRGNSLYSSNFYFGNIVKSGKSCIFSGSLTKKDYGPGARLMPTGFSYDTDGDNVVQELKLSDEESAKHTIHIN